ncbi:hypothetical protein [Nocardioides sp. Arc9.136]|uniref:hypothetical protein n=1 Tax=Nocardioides sp. Arc9.136 TaxID=2996826 RepID=UPI0026668FE4|nr:hypothetical protein [Nocardioides sp. Arc9.136]WKN47163.1 hypothetical protein OSR43_14055 [Nocardioides sp. Arc9.136]
MNPRGVVTRRRVLARRRAAGKQRPRQANVLTVNAASVSERPNTVREIVDRTLEAAERHNVVLIRMCEAGDVRAAWFGEDWDVFHDETEDVPGGGPRAGTLLAAQRDRATLSNAELVLLTSGGHGIRDRYGAVACVTVDPGTPYRWSWRDVAFHAPPKRAWVLWPGYMLRLAQLAADNGGGDSNRLIRTVAPALPGRRVQARHIMATFTRPWIPTRRVRRIAVGSDHPALLDTLWPAPRPRRKENR